jgi:DNA-binding NarL/FixJ family response regulator
VIANPAPAERRVLVADADPTVRSALRLVLTRASGLHAITEANSANDLLAAAARTTPNLILLDWSLSNTRPEDLVAALRALVPSVMLVVLSTRPEPRSLAMAAGADAFVCKSDGPAVLLAAVQPVA